MRLLFSTVSSPHHMAPPPLADEQVNCGPLMPERIVGERVHSLTTPRGDYDLAAIAARLPAEQKPEAVVCMVDASLANTPRNLAAFSCPKILLVADTHHMGSPILGVLKYALSQPFDRVVFLYTRHHLEMFRAAGVKNIFWFPGLTLPFADDVVRAVRSPERAPRLALTGQTSSLYRRRMRLVAALAEARLPVELRALSQLQGLRFYGSSAIALNVTANADLNLRAFEALASGSLLLMDRLAPESGIGQLWREGREYVAYGSAGELVERAAHYLAHPDEARVIAAAGAAWLDERFNARIRREAFSRLVFDGVEAPGCELPAPGPEHVRPFAALGHKLPGALAVYEHLQRHHSLHEEVIVRLDENAPADLVRLCATLPRVLCVRDEVPAKKASPDYWFTTAERAAKSGPGKFRGLWLWNAESADVAKLGARLGPAGYETMRPEVAFFTREGGDDETPPAKKKGLEARGFLRAGDIQSALATARLALTEAPDDHEAVLVMAELALFAGNQDLFAKMCARVRVLAPGDALGVMLILEFAAGRAKQRLPQQVLESANWQFALNQLGPALNTAERAWKLDPRHPGISRLLAQIYLRTAEQHGDIARGRERGLALKYLRLTTGLEPDDPAHWRELGHALRRFGIMAEAVAAWERAVALAPDDAGDWFALGEAQFALGAHARAIIAFEAGLARAPRDAHLMLWLGHALKRAGRLVEALHWHRRAVGVSGAALTLATRAKKHAVFIVQHGPSWTSTASVHAAFAADPAWETTLVALPYLHPFYTTATDEREAIFDFLAKENIRHVRWDKFTLEPGFADVVFLQNPYDITRPPGWRTPELLRLAPRLAYVPYGIEIGGGLANARFQFNLPIQQLAWAVFARSDRHKAMFAKHCVGGDAHVAVTGHPKMDAQRDLGAVRDSALEAFAAGRKLVCWNPQFDIRLNGSAFGEGFSTFLRWFEFLPAEFARRRDLAFVIRPHPLFFATMEDRGILTDAQIARFLQRCAEAGNIQIDRRPSYLPVFAASAAMLSDASSFLLEYGATGKPLLYLHNPHGPALNEDGAFVRDFCATAESEAEIARFLDEVAAGRDERGPARRAARGEFMHLAPEGAGVAIKRIVERRLAAEVEPAAVAASETPAQAADESAWREAGRAFWKNCGDTHLADRAYYARAMQALTDRLPRFVRPGTRVIDFGCGNGKMTLAAERTGAEVTGYDVSEALVREARAKAAGTGASKARFEVLDLERGLPEGRADVVLCLGVFSCIHDDAVWLAALERFARMVPAGGTLVLRESVVVGETRRVRHPNGYYACYRSRGDYLAAVAARGFKELDRARLFALPNGLENYLWVFRRTPAGLEPAEPAPSAESRHAALSLA